MRPPRAARLQRPNEFVDDASDCQQAQEIRAKWARGIFEKNTELVAEARTDLEDWNRKNPDQRIVVSTPAVVGQLLGFSPSEVRLAQEGKSAIYQQDKALGERRQELLTKAARATMDKDTEARAEAMKEIERFNQKNPTRRITPLNVLQSVRNRNKRIDQSEGGVYLPKNRSDAMDAGRFAVSE